MFVITGTVFSGVIRIVLVFVPVSVLLSVATHLMVAVPVIEPTASVADARYALSMVG